MRSGSTVETAPTFKRFTITIFLASFLLFLMQPMIARIALPRLGGAPAVWNSAMLVFQGLLLCGYWYAHLLGNLAPLKQAIVHLSAFALAALTLPIGLAELTPSREASPVLWVPWLLLMSVGPLFFVVSAQAPLLQRWFAAATGKDPYRLYAASNVGSFGGLISYPLLVEPLVPVAYQRWIWSAAYLMLAALVGWCSLALRHNWILKPSPDDPGSKKPATGSLLTWGVVAAVPSGLVLSTTLHITTDIVAMPLLWVLPLGVYLLSFSIAFAARDAFIRPIVWIAPIVLLLHAFSLFVRISPSSIEDLALPVLSLFVVSVSLHKRIYDTRPPPEQLTTFYLAIAAGGVIGGSFCALIAPLVFNWTYEHPLLLVAAALLMPGFSVVRPLVQELWKGRVSLPAIALLTIGSVFLLSMAGIAFPPYSLWIAAVIANIAFAAIGNRPLFGLSVAALLLCAGGWSRIAASLEEGRLTRSYFGVLEVTDGRAARTMNHGTTLHGIQNRGSAARERMPTSYYAAPSGVGFVLGSSAIADDANVSVIGLGTGTLACYARPQQTWTFYEIDPVVVELARNPARFTFLSRCQPKSVVVVGDARQTLREAPSSSVDVLVVDAFSSDSIPMHLLTREAFQTYRSRLRADGILLVHISNRHLDLEQVIAAEALANRWFARKRLYRPDAAAAALNHRQSTWVAMSPSGSEIAKVEALKPGGWERLRQPSIVQWSDDHASVLPILRF